jgi:hypothetical protein
MVLTVDRLSIPLVETPMGPLLSTDGGPLEPLSWLVNQSVTGILPGLAELLNRGEDIYLTQISARRPDSDENVETARAQWRDLTGEDPGPDVYLIQVDFLKDPLLVPRHTLTETLTRLRELRERAPKPPAPWLFRADPRWNEPAPEERELLAPLEDEARELDRLEQCGAEPADPITLARTVVKRRDVLIGIRTAGLLADGFAAVRLHWLRQWSMNTLAGYIQAAIDLRLYLRSRERWEIMPDSVEEPLDACGVSLDWFRCSVTPPAGYEPLRWLALCERALREAPPLTSNSGPVFTRIDEGWYQIDWRREFGDRPRLFGWRRVSV